MARLRCDFYSDALGLGTSMTVLLPRVGNTQIGIQQQVSHTKPPVLYLLHGLSDDDTTWTRHTSIERYATQLGLAVVMPQVQRSFYTDETHGNRYWTFVSEELPTYVETFFRVSTRREDTFVAGLSMGGYGAMKWALRQPDRFAAAASLSGALDMARRWRTGIPDHPALMSHVFGDTPVASTTNDLLWLLDQIGGNGADLPRLSVCCGTEDSLHPESVTFCDVARANRIDVTADFSAGDHDWAYWDAKIRDVLTWMLSRGTAQDNPGLHPRTAVVS